MSTAVLKLLRPLCHSPKRTAVGEIPRA